MNTGLHEQPHIEGVEAFALDGRPDDRGMLTEIFRSAWLPGRAPFVQANVSVSRAGVLRGLHFHRIQADYWVVLDGRAFVALVDLRSGSPTDAATTELRIDTGDRRLALYVPPGVAHGFYAETPVTLLYLVDREFTGDDEFGLAWDDPGAAIRWPNARPILSERDRGNPPLSTARAHAPAFARG